MYYEVHGNCAPLVLLHSGVGAIEMFTEDLPLLTKGWQVIGMDLQAYGRSADIERPLRFDLMADGIADLIKYLLDEVPRFEKALPPSAHCTRRFVR
jgi:pimeloyl-ACP methyl ester carboxylesterase